MININLKSRTHKIQVRHLNKRVTIKHSGTPGVGVPIGGTTGQVLAKNSNTNYDTEWVDQTGGGGAQTYDEFVYNSSGVQEDNRFNDWADLYTALSSQEGQKRITFEQNETLPADTYNFDNVTFSGDGTSPNLGGIVLVIPTGFIVTSWLNGRLEGGLGFYYQANVPMLTFNTGLKTFSVGDGSLIASTQAPVFDIESTGSLILKFEIGSGLFNAGYEVVRIAAGGVSYNLMIGSNSQIGSNVFRGTVNSFNGLILLDSAGTAINEARTDANLTGTMEIVLANSAKFIGFDNSSNGFTATNVQEAIEEAAGGGGGSVGSVFGRTGAVTAATSDYDASQIDNTPAGTIASTDVQSAINELDTEIGTKMELIGTYSFGSDNINFYDGSSSVDIDSYVANNGDVLRVRTGGNKNFGGGTIYGEENDLLYYDNTIWKLIKNFTTTVGTLAGDSLLATGTASANQIRTLSTSTYPSLTELSYVKGATSSIQTQINSMGTLADPHQVGGIPVRASGLDDWFTALASATAASPIDVVYVGDSLHALGTVYQGPVPALVEKYLNMQLGVGYTPVPSGVYGQADYSPTATTTQGTTSTTALGGFGSTLTNGQVLTHVETCTSVSIAYRTDPSYGTLTIRDGAGGTVLGTINCAATAKSGNVWTSSAISDTSHTIHITSTGTTRVEIIHPNRGHKVRVWNCSHAGYTSTQYKDNDYLANDLIDTLQAAGTLKLVVIGTGANDDAAPYSTVIPQLITEVETHTTATLALWFPYISGAFPLSEYTDARTAAYATGLPVIDASTVAGTAVGFDGTHPDIWQKRMLAIQETAILGGDPIGTLTRELSNINVGGITVPSPTGPYAEFGYVSELLKALYGASGPGIVTGDGTTAFGDTTFARKAAAIWSVNNGTGTIEANLSPAINAQTGTSYTLVLADAGKTITRSNGSASTQTLPQNSDVAIPVGTIINILNLGAGEVTFAAGTGATITGIAKIKQYQNAYMIKTATNTWNIAAPEVTLTGTETLTNKTLTTPTIGSFTNATHSHQNAAGGGTLDHGLALTGLTDDDHTQYALLSGRSGGQELKGGTATSDDLKLWANSNAYAYGNTGRIRPQERMDFSDISTTTDGINELIKYNPTITTSSTSAIMMGINFYPTISRSAAQGLSFSPAFYMAQKDQVSAQSLTDNIYSWNMGAFAFNKQTINYDTGSGGSTLVAGFVASPQVFREDTKTGTRTLANFTGFNAFQAPFLSHHVGDGYTITNARGFHAVNPTMKSGGSGVITTNIGVDVEAMTSGTTDVGVRIAKADTYTVQLSDTGGTAAGGITFGTDTTLYRSAADTLKTDDNLIVGTAGTSAGSVATIDGTQTFTNKTHTSPVLNTGVSGTAVLDEDDMASDSNTKLATQQSIKAYTYRRTAVIKPTSGDYYSMGGQTGAGTAGLTASGKIVFHPLWLETGTLDRIAVSTSVAAVATWRLGLYKQDPTTGLPDGMIPFLDAGTVDMNATAGVQAITISQAITDPGLYWAAVLVDAYTAQPTTHNVVYSSNSGGAIHGLPQDMSSLSRYRVGRSYGSTVTTGSLPTAPTSSMTWAGTIPRVAVRYT